MEGNNQEIKGSYNSVIGNINIHNPTTEDLFKQEIYRLSNENNLLERSNAILEREIDSFKEILEQYRNSQDLIKELYERKISDLKRMIDIYEMRVQELHRNK